MPKQPMTIGRECIRRLKQEVSITYPPKGRRQTAALEKVRQHISTEIAQAEQRGMMFGAAVMAGYLVNGMGECVAAKGALAQFGQSPADWAGLGLTPYDMRAVRKAFREG